MLDEPFNQVDAAITVMRLQHDIRQIVKEWGVTVILVSHDPAELLEHGRRAYCNKRGRDSGTRLARKAVPLAKTAVYTAKILVSCSELTAAQAAVCGIKSKRGTVVIYAEHVSIGGIGAAKKWLVKQVLFKGFFEELGDRTG
jgi:ABC-type sulfate/molybdate transport systems ATPase subunit